MADFPRAIMPSKVTDLNAPGPLIRWTHEGRLWLRNHWQTGRWWEEEYPPLKMSNSGVRAWLTAIQAGYQAGTVWDIQHLFYLTKNGGGTGSPTVSGASQVGSTLVTTGWGGSQPYLKAGDIITVAGLSFVLEMTADSSGGTLSIFPPIPPGQSPAGGAAITHATVKFRVRLVTPPEIPLSLPANGYLAGIKLLFREAF